MSVYMIREKGMKMLNIDENFFKEETRCGFTISSEMKHLWAAQMKVLSYVIGVCEKYNIQYFADFGTLLGAVRHKGYIPWDDDIDISLKRSDYRRLLEALKLEANPEFVINNCYEGNGIKSPIHTTVFNYKSVPMPREVVDRFYGCPYATGIDVYVLDYIPRDEELKKAQRSMYLSVAQLADDSWKIKQAGELDNYVKKIEDMCQVKLINDDTIAKQLWQLADRIAAMFTEEESDELVYWGEYAIMYPDRILKKEWFDSAVKMQFNTMMIDVPSGYDKILSKEYGNYMEMHNVPSTHGYPVYAEQKEFLESIGWFKD